MSTVVLDFHCSTSERGRIRMKRGKPPPPVEAGSTPRITRLMALALRFDHLLREGVVQDYAELARLGHVTRARMTQIMGLLNLATDIQEGILFLPRTVKGRDPISAREVIAIATQEDWKQQRQTWQKILLPQTLNTVVPPIWSPTSKPCSLNLSLMAEQVSAPLNSVPFKAKACLSLEYQFKYLCPR